jgi:chromate reductase
MAQTQDRLTMVAISGSLRRQSLNTALVRAVQEMVPEGSTLDLLEIGALPLYNADLDTEQPPAAVIAFKQRISAADAVLIATPEYNYGIPGPLKNAMDWASRPAYKAPFTQKPVAIMGASPGGGGTVRAQGQLKQVLLGMLSQVFPYPEMALTVAGERFDAEGRLTDARTREHLVAMLQQFMQWVLKVR